MDDQTASGGRYIIYPEIALHICIASRDSVTSLRLGAGTAVDTAE